MDDFPPDDEVQFETHDIIQPGYRVDEGVIAEFDQIHSEAINQLRDADSFFLVVENEQGMSQISAVKETRMEAPIFFAKAMKEVKRLLIHALETRTHDDEKKED